MKINEIEKIVGISKKNIRFYEDQGLLSPSRNKDNGYREYSDSDIKALEQIKLFRKLGLPLEEIRLMQQGKSTVSDSMKRHLVTLERESRNLEHAYNICDSLKSKEILLDDLDVQSILATMKELEAKGASFRDISSSDKKSTLYIGSITSAVAFVLLMALTFLLILWAAETDPAGRPPMVLLVILLATPMVTALGCLFSLIQRIKEIQKGEMEDAKKY